MRMGLDMSLMRSGGGGGPYSPPASIVVTNSLNTTSVLQGDGSYLVTKTSADAWDGAAVTAVSFTGDYMMVIRPLASNKNFFAGGSLNPIATTTNNGFFRALNGNGTGVLNGIVTDIIQAGPSTYLGNDYLFFKRVGGVHTVAKGLTNDPSAATALGNLGVTDSASTVGIKLSIFHLNAQFNIRAYAL